MDLYILDTLYRRVQFVDNYESAIWTERFNRYGDFELDLISTLQNRSRFPVGTLLGMKESERVMRVETIEDSTDDEGKNTFKVTGRSLEAILEDRLARGTLGNTTDTPKWTLTGTPTEIARQMFHDICVTGILDDADVIPGIIEGSSLYPEDTIAEPADEITYEIDPMTLYQAETDLSDIYRYGFRIVKDLDTGQLYWDVYMGSDRTTQQTSLPAIVFAPDLDNLQNPTELKSIASYKNAAYVITPAGSTIVYPVDVDPATTGFDRRVLLVKNDDIKDEDPDVALEKMERLGREELAKNTQYAAFDGEIPQNSAYKYGRDYYMGDLVEARNTDGVTNQMQVTEWIRVSDSEGEKSYPTLTIAKFITPGSWSAWDFNQVWSDMGPTEYWEDQP